MTTAAIRNKLYDFIRVADNKKLQAIYHLLENDIEKENVWWGDKQFVAELDKRYNDLETGADKGVSIKELETSIDKLRQKKFGNC
jgi:hypothetical protein